MSDKAMISSGVSASGQSTRRAVVDIGSNSVRLVIYDGAARAPSQICNEKALCGLGRDMAPDGSMNADSVKLALSTLRRFRLLLDRHGAPPTHVIATAAVREATDGEQFVRDVKNIGFDVETIDGEREAALAAMGVLSYNPDANGLVGDMGGGSLELVSIGRKKNADAISLSVGPLRLMQKTGNDIGLAPKIIDKEISKVEWLTPGRFETLYAVGGAWRAVARIQMRLRSYALSVLHQFEMSRSETIRICDLIARQSRRSLEEIPGIPRRRIDTLPFAALVLKEILVRTKAERMVVSAGGVREGLIYESMTAEIRAEDPLFSGAAFFSERLSPAGQFGAAVARVTDTLFADDNGNDRRLRRATCALIDVGAYFHPDLRGDHAFDTALRAPFYAVSHKERVSIALSLFVRYNGRRAAFPDDQTIGLLSWEEQQRAMRIGLAMRFLSTLAPKAGGLLDGCALRLDGDAIVFSGPRIIEQLMEELPRRRLQSLAAAFEREAREEFSD